MGLAGDSEWSDLTTLDHNADHKPDVLHDLADIPLPFDGNEFDEIHAYHVLEHVGRQGDWRFFFDQFSDFHRLLKPGGLFFGVVPSWTSEWAFGDPSHTRVLPLCCLTFLDQQQYAAQVGITPMTDFRFYYAADFEVLESHDDGLHAKFALRSRK
jgi:hypothetical protein